MNIQEIKTKYKQAPGPNTGKSLAMLQYIEDLASKTGTNISDWDASIFLKDDHVYSTKTTINKIFFERKEQTTTRVVQEVTDLGTELKNALNKYNKDRIAKAIKIQTQKREECVKQATQLQEDCAEQLKQAYTFTRAIEIYSKGEGPTFGDQIIDLLKDGLLTFESFDGKILKLSTQDIINTEVNPTAKLDLRVNLGQYLLEIDIETLRIFVKKFKNNISVGPYYHPHVNYDGNICQGNAAAAYANLTASAQVKELVQLIVTILQTYNPGNPYKTLADFHLNNPNKEDRVRLEAPKAEIIIGKGATPFVEEELFVEEGYDCAECEDEGCEECEDR